MRIIFLYLDKNPLILRVTPARRQWDTVLQQELQMGQELSTLNKVSDSFAFT